MYDGEILFLIEYLDTLQFNVMLIDDINIRRTIDKEKPGPKSSRQKC